MSDIPPNTLFMKPDYTPFCEHGHGELQWRVTQSDKNGNRGCWMVASPTSSPNPSPPPSGPPPQMMLTPVVPGVCADPECTSKHVHPQCSHLMCRKHCWASGGCNAKGHGIAGPVGEVPHDPTMLCISSGAAPPPPIIDPALLLISGIASSSSSSQAPTAGLSTLPTPSQVTLTRKGKGCATAVPAPDVDFYSNPCLPSQLLPVFTDAYAKQEAERLQKQEVESLKCELALTVQNTVTVFGWAADGDTPAVCEFQSGFVLPRVRVTAEWLHNLGLSVDDSCHYFNVTQQCWNRIFVGHVLTLPGNHVYLKNLNVKVALDFDKYYIDQQPPTIPHIRNNLKASCVAKAEATILFQLFPSLTLHLIACTACTSPAPPACTAHTSPAPPYHYQA
ncbi:uncharacterized protein EDB91DRAFT_1250205 [Suillus paluster]|uniref:uncharacterized protein n=1 Tax=Suillus paluster TaxID=48578 RepID=UPI001B87E4EF|nr:uncharacterized protein EDB91DRAFT_1250205 [Suillus paluster]KAG1735874.1 hypothetical protein EDB91DRAFT_1250205 [Suillus paluster]